MKCKRCGKELRFGAGMRDNQFEGKLVKWYPEEERICYKCEKLFDEIEFLFLQGEGFQVERCKNRTK